MTYRAKGRDAKLFRLKHGLCHAGICPVLVALFGLFEPENLLYAQGQGCGGCRRSEMKSRHTTLRLSKGNMAKPTLLRGLSPRESPAKLMQNEPHKAQTHSLLEDAQGFLFGTSICAFALIILRSLGLITGQTAGLAILISYTTDYSFGLVFFLVNIPFYWFGLQRMGRKFVAKTFINVALISLFAEVFPLLVSFEHIDPFFGAILFGLLTGAGLMAIFRHGGSLGGIGILALYLQDAIGWKAGWVQLGFDACLFAVAFFLLPLPLVAYSLIGAVVVNVVIAINHRRDRYIAV